jgi:hypothetical protein
MPHRKAPAHQEAEEKGLEEVRKGRDLLLE